MLVSRLRQSHPAAGLTSRAVGNTHASALSTLTYPFTENDIYRVGAATWEIDDESPGGLIDTSGGENILRLSEVCVAIIGPGAVWYIPRVVRFRRNTPNTFVPEQQA